MNILISHIPEEALIALLLKDFIESTFLGQFEVLLGKNVSDIGVGDKWLVELDGSLTSADLLLVLCSPKSIRQPWIHFEFGCAWTKSMAISCLCHSGLNKEGLPPHLRTFDVLEVDDEGFMEELFADLAKRFGIKRLPRLSYDTMKAELRATLVSLAHGGEKSEAKISPVAAGDQEQGVIEATTESLSIKEVEASEAPHLLDKELEEKIDERIEEKIREKEEPSKPKPPPPSEPKPPPPSKPKPPPPSKPGVVVKRKKKKGGKKKDTQAEPESVQKRVLTLLAEAGDTGYPLEDLADLLGIVEAKLEPVLDVLKDQAFINISVEVGRPPEYKIAAKGEQYLTESKI